MVTKLSWRRRRNGYILEVEITNEQCCVGTWFYWINTVALLFVIWEWLVSNSTLEDITLTLNFMYFIKVQHVIQRLWLYKYFLWPRWNTRNSFQRMWMAANFNMIVTIRVLSFETEFQFKCSEMQRNDCHVSFKCLRSLITKNNQSTINIR